MSQRRVSHTNYYKKFEVVNLGVYEPDPTVPNAFTALEAALNHKHAHDTPNTVVVLCYNDRWEFSQFKEQYPTQKIVVYQLEQISSKVNGWWNDASVNDVVIERTARIKRWLDGCDEIWEYDLANFNFLQLKGFGAKLVFKPMEFSEANVYSLPEEEKVYDVAFFGSINLERLKFLKAVNDKFSLCCVGVYGEEHRAAVEASGVTVLPAEHGRNVWKHLIKSRIILNLHYYDGIQEQVRLTDLLCNNQYIISQKSNWNYFNGLITEFTTQDEMVGQIAAALKLDTDKLGREATAKYKNRTYRPYRIGAVYNSFYDLDLLETSLRSIRSAVDYIAVIHQPVSFKGELSDPSYGSVLSDLTAKGLVDEVVIYEDNHSVVDKRNLGLSLCIRNGCNYIMPMDNDECYNAEDLKDEVDFMFANNLHTVYCPIYSYYHDIRHYFQESYYVPAVYKIDERVFKQLSTFSVLVDPDRRMDENNYTVSRMAMHHLTYLPSKFSYTGTSNPRNEYYRDAMERLRTHFSTWKDGDKALVFANGTGGRVTTAEVELIKTGKRLFSDCFAPQNPHE